VVRARPDGSVVPAAGPRPFRAGFTGNGGPALDAYIHPIDVAPTPDGGFLIAEATDWSDVRKVWPNGTITTVAGRTVPGDHFGGSPNYDAQWNALEIIGRPRLRGGSVKVKGATTLAADITLTLTKRGRTVGRASRHVPAGYFELATRKPPHGRYTVKLVGRAGGRTKQTSQTANL